MGYGIDLIIRLSDRWKVVMLKRKCEWIGNVVLFFTVCTKLLPIGVDLIER